MFWEHRNLFGAAEKLILSLDGTEIDQTAIAMFSKPGFISPRQSLKLATEFHHADTDAFREWSTKVSAALERRLGEHWTVSAGVLGEAATIKDDGASTQSYLAGLPLAATWSTVEAADLLDPTKGWRVSMAAAPYAGSSEGSIAFLESEAQASVYLPLDSAKRHVFAARVRVGSLVGAATTKVPANHRFYAGGGGSIRGYGYQLVGPFDVEGRPTGGRSLLEAGVETRLRLTETVGIVPFVDVGAVSASSIPGG